MTLSQSAMELVVRGGWTLLHTLWQFAAVACLSGLALSALPRARATTRHTVALGGLLAMAVLPVVTWFALPGPSTTADAAYRAEPPIAAAEIVSTPQSMGTGGVPEQSDWQSPVAATGPAAAAPADAMHELTTTAGSTTPNDVAAAAISASLRARIEPWLPELVVLWCVGVLLFALRLVVGWLAIRRLRTLDVRPVPNSVQALLRETAGRLGVWMPVSVLESARVHAPLVIGLLRPLILLPATAITGLPASQLQAILAHELAHVRRLDGVVNLLQILLETLFFYHPAVWRQSRRLRFERENCCDDLAVAVHGNRVEYGRALLAMEEFRGARPVLALGVADGSLLARIQRITGPDVPRSPIAFGGLAMLVLFAATASLGIWTATQAADPDTPEPAAATAAAADPPDAVASDDEHFVYQCVVVDESSGAPIPGAEVAWRIRHYEPDSGYITDWEQSFVADATGGYTARVPRALAQPEPNDATRLRIATGSPEEPRVRLIVWIEASHRDYLPVKDRGYPSYLPDEDAGIQPDHRRLKLRRGVEVTGRFLLPNGAPAKGLSVMVARDRDGFGDSTGHGFYTRTDDEGRFRLVTLNTWPQRLHWLPGNHQSDSKALSQTFGDQGTIRLKPGPRIAGRVVDEGGAPLAGLAIQASTGTRVPYRHAVSDADGRFTFPPLPPGEYRLLPVAGFVDPQTGEFEKAASPPPFDALLYTLAEGAAPALLQAPETVALKVNVVDGDGKPLSNRRIFESSWPTHLAGAPAPGTPGAYEIRFPKSRQWLGVAVNISAGEALLYQRTPDEPAVPGTELRLANTGSALRPVTVQALKAGTIKIHVRSEADEPVNLSDILFDVEYVGAETYRTYGTDGRGFQQVSYSNEPPGRTIERVVPGLDVSIRLSGGGWEPVGRIVQVQPGETQTVEIVLKKPGAADANDGSADASPESHAAESTDDGDAGTTNAVDVTTPAAPPESPAVAPTAETAEPAAEDAVRRAITGTIVDDQGLPVPDADVALQVWAFGLDGLPAGPFRATTTSGVDGAFALPIPADVQPDQALGTVWVLAEGYLPTRPLGYGVLNGLLHEPVQLRLVRGAKTSIQILDERGAPVVNARVTVRSQRLPESISWPTPDDWASRLTAVTDANGIAETPHALPDAISGLDLQPAGASALVRLDQDFFLNVRPAESAPQFTLRLPDPGRIAGRLTGPAASRLPAGLSIEIQTESRLPESPSVGTWGVSTIAVDGDGEFAVEGIAPGMILAPPFLAEDQPLRALIPDALQVRGGESTALDIAIVDGTPIRGRIIKQDTGEGAAGVRLLLIYGQSALRHRSMRDAFQLVTDERGEYSAIVPPGPVEVRLQSGVDGYRSTESWGPRVGHWGTRYDVPDVRNAHDLPPIELAPSVTITGTLVDQAGQPLSDWVVYGYPDLPGVPRESWRMNSFAGVHSDRQGRFEGQAPNTHRPAYWRVSHRDWPSPYRFDDQRWDATIQSENPLVLQVDLSRAPRGDGD
ncbi:MAG: carboxypeptidase regulatory-like domain-containing protein [Planctomyces sp.]|nr:carboxypeptidase regulatory-like domain-containing protein [Planctomyces sp.]